MLKLIRNRSKKAGKKSEYKTSQYKDIQLMKKDNNIKIIQILYSYNIVQKIGIA